MDIREHIESRVSPIPDTGCWLWTGIVDRYGYAEIKRWPRRVSAHRVSYEAYKGPIPAGALVCHSCDIPSCVNPAHLHLGTHSSNMQERNQRGRFVPRGKQTQPRLGRAQFEQILVLRAAGLTLKELGAQFGVTMNRISQICNHWRPAG